MFGSRIHLFTLFGFPIYIDLSWFIIVVLVMWSLAEGWFGNKQLYPDLQDRIAARWLMGAAGALGLFGSIVIHELAHAKVAERYGLPMRGITLFIFGGVAEMAHEPPSAKAEFMVAIAGPIASIVIAGLCLGAAYLGSASELPQTVTGVLWYLGIINIVLVVFNMIPAFPLDGGRVLRSILWATKNNLRWATNITSQIGSGFGVALMILAAVQLLAGNFIGAMWWFLIGLFLRGAARMSYQQLLIRRLLEGEPLDRFMNTKVITVSPNISAERVVEDYIYQYHHKLYPVVDNSHLKGCITLSQIKQMPREQWASTTVQQMLIPSDDTNTIERGRDAMDALARMRQSEQSRLMVVDGDQLVGVISLKDLMEFLSLKIELEEQTA